MINRNLALGGYMGLLALAIVGLLLLDLTDPNEHTNDTVGHILTLLIPGLGVLAALLAVNRGADRTDAANGRAERSEATARVYAERDELRARLVEVEVRLERTRGLREKIAELEEGLGQLSPAELRARLRSISHLRHEIDVIESKARLPVKNGG